jgi:hypothetical protein
MCCLSHIGRDSESYEQNLAQYSARQEPHILGFYGAIVENITISSVIGLELKLIQNAIQMYPTAFLLDACSDPASKGNGAVCWGTATAAMITTTVKLLC